MITSSTKLRLLPKIGLIGLSLFTGFSLSADYLKLAIQPTPPAYAQTACSDVRAVTFTGRTSGSMTGKPNITTNLRATPTTSAGVLATIPPNTMLTFSGWTYGASVTDIWTGQADQRWFRVTYQGRTGWVASGVINGNPPGNPPLTCTTPPVTSGARLPWANGVTGRVSQTVHTDGYGRPSLDIAIPAGTPVLAPANVRVISQCNAGNNHRAMRLQDEQGRQYSLIHVTTANIWNGKTYRKGEQIGVVARDLPNNSCARSRGVHLHFGLPSNPASVGGYNLGSGTPLNTPLTAR